MTCDLHVHSSFSDGTLSPAELISLAEKLGISAVALCDHNTVNGLPDFIKAAKESKVIAINGIEISTEHNGAELHILGLFLPEEKFAEISDMMAAVKKRKEESNRNLVENLRKDGYHLDYDEIKSKNGGAFINRAHIAAELVDKGYFADRKKAFGSVLSPDGGYYFPPERLKSLDVISYLASIGAIPVWAHPFLDMTADEIDAFLPVAKANGLVGMETRYSLYDEETQKTAETLAKKHGIKQSGGSDFHGGNKPDIAMGTGKGSLCVPFEFYKNLKNITGGITTISNNSPESVFLAYLVAKEAHKGQVDKAGVDYIQHPLTVSSFVDGDKEKICALLHDVMEDTEFPEIALRILFGDEIVNTLLLLTHRDGESYDEYIERISESKLATRVKIADLTHNSDLSRLKEVTEKDKKRLEKYQRSIEYLNNKTANRN